MYFDKMEFGVRIQQLRTAQGKTQEDLAEQLNVSKEYVSKMERGIRKCSFDNLVALSCILHVSTDYLLTGKEADGGHNRDQLLSVISQLSEIARNL